MAVDLAQKAQNFTNRGRQALEAGKYELAVDMLMEAVSAAPDVLETRKLLRAAQIAHFRKDGKAGFGAVRLSLRIRNVQDLAVRSDYRAADTDVGKIFFKALSARLSVHSLCYSERQTHVQNCRKKDTESLGYTAHDRSTACGK